ncbi:MAG TPA: hypothetical protein VGH87_05645 [Polyangiaceae bacterium]
MFAAVLFFAAPRADASVSFTVPMDALVEESSAACVVSPLESKSVWENGRIATYTRAHVDRVLAGSTASTSEVWIKTLGGAVGDIGQNVDGEAVLRPGRQSVVFLSTFEGSLVVTARGQGQFALVGGHLRKNVWAGALLAPNPSVLTRIRARTTEAEAISPAADVLDGKTIDEAAAHIAAAWTRTHAPVGR